MSDVRGASSSTVSTVGRYRLVVWLLAVLALGIILWNARRAYFVFDDWTYWTTRQDFLAVEGIKGTLKVLFVPHNGQLPTLTFLVWLPLDWLFGMHTYIPYLLPAILVHLATGVLLFELLVRRLRPEVAFGAALLYLSMGNAGASAVDASALGWTIAVPAIFLGLLAMERYEGGDPRRLVLFMLGAVVLGGTGMGFVVLFVLGMALIIRRRYAIAAVVATGFGLLFLLWRLMGVFYPTIFPTVGSGQGAGSLPVDASRLGDYLSFIWTGLTGTVEDLFGIGLSPIGVGLLAVAVLAAVLTVVDGNHFVYAASAAGALFFYLLVAVRGVELNLPAYTADQPRYMWVAGTLLLPSLAWAADRIIRVRQWMIVPLVLALAWAVVVNVPHHLDLADERVALGISNRATIETAASILDDWRRPWVGSRAEELAPLAAGILVAGRSARISVFQLERLDSLGKLPCVADYERALGFTRAHDLPDPAPDVVHCR